MRGRLLQEDDASCLTDDLGRSVCFTFPVILSLILSVVLIIVKGNSGKQNESLKSLPCLALSMMFRSVSFAFILIYIDYWSVIPFSILFILQIVLTEYSMKEKPFEDIEVDFDDTDAPCVLIWNGNEWVPREPGLDLDEENSTEHNNPMNISTVITATLNIFISRNIFEDLSRQNILLPIVTNLLILAVIVTIFCLVTYIQQFHYEPNILVFNSFIGIIVGLFCYGFLSPAAQKLYLMQKIKHKLITEILSIIISILFVLTLPFVILLCIKVEGNGEFYFYTINSDDNLTEVKMFPFKTNQELTLNDIDKTFFSSKYKMD